MMNTKRRLDIMKKTDKANKRHVEEWQKDRQGDRHITAVFVDVYGRGDIRTVRIMRDLGEYYRLLGCRVVDMPTRWIGGKPFIIICDDEGLLRSDFKVSACNGNEPMLVGNLLVVGFDGCDDIRGLTDEEVKHILRHTGTPMWLNALGQKETWTALTNVTYR